MEGHGPPRGSSWRLSPRSRSACGIAACGSSSSADSGSVDIVAYSTPETVYKDGLIPAFKKTSQGADASFSTSFGPSGDQSRAVESGQPASVVHFSIQPDMQRLVDAGQVDSNWDQNSYNGFVRTPSSCSSSVRATPTTSRTGVTS